ncbi:MAG: 1-acyl-sn-glycerol-3-phosphate acyltransferase [Bacteroidaceae bacterium]|nr:1-acyl-sn-glycerol-3-phosphate acyltransferase [Bacteroidaceae bacterium]
MKFVYILYQIFVAAPILLVATLLTAVTTFFGCRWGNGAFWGYYPGKWWGWAMCRVMLLPVEVEGRENIDSRQSYVFVANHQGSYDIFLVYGFLGHSFRWMMKASLRQMPLIGTACEAAGHIMVNRRSASGVRQTIEQGRKVLCGGTSLFVFPEGARTFSGTMGFFRKGAFQLADELQLPVVPVTIEGSFDVLPRQRKLPYLTWHPLRLVIHQPIQPVGKGDPNLQHLMTTSRDAIERSLSAAHQGYVENPDQ